MNTAILQAIEKEIDEVRGELAQTTIRLVNIKSVKEDPLPGAPFGAGPRAVLDEVLKMGDEAGFFGTDYGVAVASLSMKEGQPDLGIWLHGDVVPEGSGWIYEPYNAIEYKGCIIGRGATDNKGQLAAIYHLFKIFKKLGIELKYNPAMYVGSNEEFGMTDMIGIPGNEDAKGFLNVCTPPRLSLVPDGGFPAGYGGKGGINIRLKSKTPLHGWSLSAGKQESPGIAEAVFDSDFVSPALAHCEVKVQDGCTVISAYTPPRHGAHPDPNGNMITRLSEALLEHDLVPAEDRYILEFLRDTSLNIDGELLGIAATSEYMPPLTVFASKITEEDGCPVLSINVRYPYGITFDEIVERVTTAADARGFTVYEAINGTPAYLNDPNTPIVKLLCDASNEVIGNDAKPYTLSGGTYAHRLPNAYVFGMSGNLPPEGFPEGHGGAHGIDECVSLDRLQRAMRIYARALLKLNETDW